MSRRLFLSRTRTLTKSMARRWASVLPPRLMDFHSPTFITTSSLLFNGRHDLITSAGEKPFRTPFFPKQNPLWNIITSYCAGGNGNLIASLVECFRMLFVTCADCGWGVKEQETNTSESIEEKRKCNKRSWYSARPGKKNVKRKNERESVRREGERTGGIKNECRRKGESYDGRWETERQRRKNVN